MDTFMKELHNLHEDDMETLRILAVLAVTIVFLIISPGHVLRCWKLANVESSQGKAENQGSPAAVHDSEEIAQTSDDQQGTPERQAGATSSLLYATLVATLPSFVTESNSSRHDASIPTELTAFEEAMGVDTDCQLADVEDEGDNDGAGGSAEKVKEMPEDVQDDEEKAEEDAVGTQAMVEQFDQSVHKVEEMAAEAFVTAKRRMSQIAESIFHPDSTGTTTEDSSEETRNSPEQRDEDPEDATDYHAMAEQLDKTIHAAANRVRRLSDDVTHLMAKGHIFPAGLGRGSGMEEEERKEPPDPSSSKALNDGDTLINNTSSSNRLTEASNKPEEAREHSKSTATVGLDGNDKEDQDEDPEHIQSLGIAKQESVKELNEAKVPYRALNIMDRDSNYQAHEENNTGKSQREQARLKELPTGAKIGKDDALFSGLDKEFSHLAETNNQSAASGDSNMDITEDLSREHAYPEETGFTEGAPPTLTVDKDIKTALPDDHNDKGIEQVDYTAMTESWAEATYAYVHENDDPEQLKQELRISQDSVENLKSALDILHNQQLESQEKLETLEYTNAAMFQELSEEKGAVRRLSQELESYRSQDELGSERGRADYSCVTTSSNPSPRTSTEIESRSRSSQRRSSSSASEDDKGQSPNATQRPSAEPNTLSNASSRDSQVRQLETYFTETDEREKKFFAEDKTLAITQHPQPVFGFIQPPDPDPYHSVSEEPDEDHSADGYRQHGAQDYIQCIRNLLKEQYNITLDVSVPDASATVEQLMTGEQAFLPELLRSLEQLDPPAKRRSQEITMLKATLSAKEAELAELEVKYKASEALLQIKYKQLTSVGLDIEQMRTSSPATVEAGRPMHQYEIHVQCKIEKSTPLIRGSVMLPKGLKDESKVLVFAEAKKAEEARQAGAAYVGGADLIDQVQKGQVVFDKCIATPEMLPQVAKIARVLGPKGLMPTTKKGTVTDDILSTVQKARGSFDFKGDKQGVVHTGVGCISFEDKDVEANIRTILDEIRNFGRQHALK
ncbi:hypothetical protein BZG36_04461, partial [Bifiguratus adelaidae]